MSCMSAMHWATIDYLPVVELFKSLLPGTGSAAFELIRGLYDDQNLDSPRLLQYRGIPTYPSAGGPSGCSAIFFTATHTGGDNPLNRVHEPTPVARGGLGAEPASPRALRGPASSDLPDGQTGQRAQGDEKRTTSAVCRFVPPNQRGFAPCGKRAVVHSGLLLLSDHKTSHEIALQPGWGITHQLAHQAGDQAAANKENSWEGFFPDGVPAVSPQEAYSAVLLYPEDDAQNRGTRKPNPLWRIG